MPREYCRRIAERLCERGLDEVSAEAGPM
jgi:hypothetical protein